MRTIAHILISLLLGLAATYGQDRPKPPKTPDTEECCGKSNSKSTSVHVDGDSYTYFSTSDSDDTYRVKAKYNTFKTDTVRTYLLKELGRKNLVTSGSKYTWKVEYGGDKAYEVKLDDGSLRIFFDKELTSSGIASKLKTITKNIKSYTSGKPDGKRQEEHAAREAARLEREADRIEREAERLRREAERLKREAARLERESKTKNGN